MWKKNVNFIVEIRVYIKILKRVLLPLYFSNYWGAYYNRIFDFRYEFKLQTFDCHLFSKLNIQNDLNEYFDM